MAVQNGLIDARVSRRGVTLAVVAAAIAALAACGSGTTEPTGPQSESGVPLNWTVSTADTTVISTGLEQVSPYDGISAAYVHGMSLAAGGNISQRIDAAPFRGQRVKASVWVNESLLTKNGAFTVQVDAPSARSQSSVSIQTPESGSDTWHQVFVVFDVPTNAVGLTVVAGISGSGQMFFDDVALAQVDSTTALTTSLRVGGASDSLSLVALYAGAHSTLLNGDFESGLATSGQ